MENINDFGIEFSGVDDALVAPALREAADAAGILENGSGPGAEFRGWITLPERTTAESLGRLADEASRLARLAETVVVVGIGGSYLGAKAVISALQGYFGGGKSAPEIVFAGHTLSEDYYSQLLGYLKGRSFAVVVISKSGTTTEPAVAFRLLRGLLYEKYGRQGAAERIVAITDERKGVLRETAANEGYATFAVPDDVGGRFSVFTPVGLLPIAVAGFDIRALMRGAGDMQRRLQGAGDDNPAVRYAAVRNALYRAGKKIEVLTVYEPRLSYIAEWWKQLFGESEGKQGRGIFPASLVNVADLHSMGQYMQEGERTLFETVISVAQAEGNVAVPREEGVTDGLGYLEGRRVGELNAIAEQGVRMAHVEGGVPNVRLTVPQANEYWIGALLYFFEKACGVSAYMLGVNPFDQPGVEAYKKNIALLSGRE